MVVLLEGACSGALLEYVFKFDAFAGAQAPAGLAPSRSGRR